MQMAMVWAMREDGVQSDNNTDGTEDGGGAAVMILATLIVGPWLCGRLLLQKKLRFVDKGKLEADSPRGSPSLVNGAAFRSSLSVRRFESCPRTPKNR